MFDHFVKLVLKGLKCRYCSDVVFNPLNANFTKWSNTLKKFVGNLATNCLGVFDHFVILALKGLSKRKLLKLKISMLEKGLLWPESFFH